MILLIGYGNPLRRDDGAGPELARRLGRLWESQGIDVRVLEEHQLLPELSTEFADPHVEMVLFADADAAAVAPRVRRIHPASGSFSSTHHLTPERLLSMSRLLDLVTPCAWLATVPGRDFDHGKGFSAVTTAALESLEERLAALPASSLQDIG